MQTSLSLSPDKAENQPRRPRLVITLKSLKNNEKRRFSARRERGESSADLTQDDAGVVGLSGPSGVAPHRIDPTGL
jgi:hypothetical protein